MATKADLEKENKALKKYVEELHEREDALTGQLNRFTFQNNMMIKILLEVLDDKHILDSFVKKGTGSIELFESISNNSSGIFDDDGQELLYETALELTNHLKDRSKAPKVKQQKSKEFWNKYRVDFNKLCAEKPEMKLSTAKQIIGNKINQDTGKLPDRTTLHRQLVTNQK